MDFAWRSVCCVFRPANGWFTCHLLVKIIFFSLKTSFQWPWLKSKTIKKYTYTFHYKLKKRKSARKVWKNTWKRGLPAFSKKAFPWTSFSYHPSRNKRNFSFYTILKHFFRNNIRVWNYNSLKFINSLNQGCVWRNSCYEKLWNHLNNREKRDLRLWQRVLSN